MSDVTDGLSNTVVTSEAAVSNFVPSGTITGASENSGDVRGDMRKSMGTTFSTPLPSNMLFSLCHATAPDRKSYPEVAANAALIRRDLTGKMWSKGYVGPTMFTTILPPNSASCYGSGPSTTGTGGRQSQSATSNHSGGVNAGMGDGAVRFVSDTVDAGNMDGGAVTLGPSKYGVWGAMGSISGGESKAL